MSTVMTWEADHEGASPSWSIFSIFNSKHMSHPQWKQNKTKLWFSYQFGDLSGGVGGGHQISWETRICNQGSAPILSETQWANSHNTTDAKRQCHHGATTLWNMQGSDWLYVRRCYNLPSLPHCPLSPPSTPHIYHHQNSSPTPSDSVRREVVIASHTWKKIYHCTHHLGGGYIIVGLLSPFDLYLCDSRIGRIALRSAERWTGAQSGQCCRVGKKASLKTTLQAETRWDGWGLQKPGHCVEEPHPALPCGFNEPSIFLVLEILLKACRGQQVPGSMARISPLVNLVHHPQFRCNFHVFAYLKIKESIIAHRLLMF